MKPCHPTHGRLWRRCTKCDELLPLESFVCDRTKATGHRSWCKLCHSMYAARTPHNPAKWKAWYAEHREEYLARRAAKRRARKRKGSV